MSSRRSRIVKIELYFWNETCSGKNSRYAEDNGRLTPSQRILWCCLSNGMVLKLFLRILPKQRWNFCFFFFFALSMLGGKCLRNNESQVFSSSETSLCRWETGEKEKESGRGSMERGKREERLFPAFSLFPSSPTHFPSGSLCAEERGGEL